MSEAAENLRRFVDALPDGPALDEMRAASIAHLLDTLLAEASAAWPDFEVSSADFLAYLAERVPFEAPLEEGLRSLHITDLYLACACGHRDARAIECFEKEHASTIAMALAGMGNLGSVEDEVRQRLREKLFVPSGTTPGSPTASASRCRSAKRACASPISSAGAMSPPTSPA